MQSCLNYNLSIDINNPHANKTQILSCFRKKILKNNLHKTSFYHESTALQYHKKIKQMLYHIGAKFRSYQLKVSTFSTRQCPQQSSYPLNFIQL